MIFLTVFKSISSWDSYNYSFNWNYSYYWLSAEIISGLGIIVYKSLSFSSEKVAEYANF